ncbi:hypothetical protein HJC23_004434 [Cyclotella cryptica]|uniref:Uncharacterized protein n=1 Tax=Cyclotella cryptica TaxID=29204 RepID=A0ABD3QE55_9STRA
MMSRILLTTAVVLNLLTTTISSSSVPEMGRRRRTNRHDKRRRTVETSLLRGRTGIPETRQSSSTSPDENDESSSSSSPQHNHPQQPPQSDPHTHNPRHLAHHPDNIPYRLFRPPSLSLSSVLSQKALRKTCILTTLELLWSTPTESKDTSWMITLGNVQGLMNSHLPLYDVNAGNNNNNNNGEGTIVAYSHRQYNFQPYERHSLCLPGRGIYTLTLWDWTGNAGGGAQYTLYSDDGRPIVTGSMSTTSSYMQSVVFTVPLAPLESEAPSVSPVPSASLSPSVDCDWVVIDILYDMYPEETSW